MPSGHSIPCAAHRCLDGSKAAFEQKGADQVQQHRLTAEAAPEVTMDLRLVYDVRVGQLGEDQVALPGHCSLEAIGEIAPCPEATLPEPLGGCACKGVLEFVVPRPTTVTGRQFDAGMVYALIPFSKPRFLPVPM